MILMIKYLVVCTSEITQLCLKKIEYSHTSHILNCFCNCIRFLKQLHVFTSVLPNDPKWASVVISNF